MGCTCSKLTVGEEDLHPKGSRYLGQSLAVSDRTLVENGATSRLTPNREDAAIEGHFHHERSRNVRGSQDQNRKGDCRRIEYGIRKDMSYLRTNILHSEQVAHVAAGWPLWLTGVAGEAVRGWIPRRADAFQKLSKIGQGTYSNVYKAWDQENKKFVALKKVRFDNMEPESVRFMAREIMVLRQLDHPNVIRLEGIVISRMSCSLYLVFEYMEHDLAGLNACPEFVFTEPQVKCYLQQLLSGLEHCHGKGVLHRDIKGSNLLLDNTGLLKIADFGLASFFGPNQRHPLTSRVVTLWYRPPELLLGATEYGVGVDLWSTGCMLGELLARRPIMPGRTEVEQLHKIFKLCGSPSDDYWEKAKLPHATIFKPQQPYKRCITETFKDFPSSALALLDNLLAIEPKDRGTAASALESEFFTTKPYACDRSSLPQYPANKGMDAKQCEVDRRQRRLTAGEKAAASINRTEVGRTILAPAPAANVDIQSNIHERLYPVAAAHYGHENQSMRSKRRKFYRNEESSMGSTWVDSVAKNRNANYIIRLSANGSRSRPLGTQTAKPHGKWLNEKDVRLGPTRVVSLVNSLSVSQSEALSQQHRLAYGHRPIVWMDASRKQQARRGRETCRAAEESSASSKVAQRPHPN